MNANLTGKTGLITGLANSQSIAFAVTQEAHRQGASLHCTYGHAKAEPHVAPLLQGWQNCQLHYLDVRDETSLEQLEAAVRAGTGKLDFLLHAMAFARRDDLCGPLLNSSLDGFLEAMDISCHSLVRLAHRFSPLMPDGGTIVTLSYEGASRVVPNYGLMGPVKAALESCVRYLAHELGSAKIRVHAISPGPMATRAASGIPGFDQLLQQSHQQNPLGDLAGINDVASLACFLFSDAAARLTGCNIPVDSGLHLY